ncbi:hypothetical protein VTN00DRAFT_772 [Thermoascus crustaceus]|uniref:uncharacterized protein n=1 Tax=Thermoascus crustaceus TaxID=5088 RepID=UPI0037432ABD
MIIAGKRFIKRRRRKVPPSAQPRIPVSQVRAGVADELQIESADTRGDHITRNEYDECLPHFNNSMMFLFPRHIAIMFLCNFTQFRLHMLK